MCEVTQHSMIKHKQSQLGELTSVHANSHIERSHLVVMLQALDFVCEYTQAHGMIKPH